MSPEQIVDHLTYCSYRHNRQTMSAEALATLFPLTCEAMEARYWSELSAYVDAGIRKDQRERHEGRPEHDRDVAGLPMRAGS